MATITRSIGSAGGRDYSTLQAWEDAAPANLVTADELWVGECYNDSEFTSSGINITFAGITADATRYRHLTAAAGQSFQDHASVRSNALRYNQANGVGIRSTATYDYCIRATEDYLRLSRLQVKHDVSGTPIYNDPGRGSVNANMIVQATTGPTIYEWLTSNASLHINIVFVFNRASSGTGVRLAGGLGNPQLIGCTFVRPSDQTAGGTAFTTAYATNGVLTSCAIFGFTTIYGNSGDWSTSSNNATNLASGLPGSSNQHSVTFTQTTPFTDADKDSLNLIPIAATALAGNGVLDATNAPLDITGFTRPAGPTIGVWQLASAGGLVAKTQVIRQAVVRASYW